MTFKWGCWGRSFFRYILSFAFNILGDVKMAVANVAHSARLIKLTVNSPQYLSGREKDAFQNLEIKYFFLLNVLRLGSKNHGFHRLFLIVLKF